MWWNQPPVHTVGHQIEVSGSGRRDDRLPQRHRLQQPLRESFGARRKQDDLQQLVEWPDVRHEWKADYCVPSRDICGETGQPALGIHSREHQSHGSTHTVQSAE
jgi:hypothetical protein